MATGRVVRISMAVTDCYVVVTDSFVVERTVAEAAGTEFPTSASVMTCMKEREFWFFVLFCF